MSTYKTIMVNEGDTIKLPCVVDKLDNFVIIWKKGAGILAVGDKPFDGKDARIKIEKILNGNRLVISLADFSDEGEYTCQLSALKTIELKHSVKVRGKQSITFDWSLSMAHMILRPTVSIIWGDFYFQQIVERK